MSPPRTTGHLAIPPIQPKVSPTPPAPSWQKTVAPIGDALLALVVSVESQPTAGPAVKAFQSAIRRKGEEAGAAGGVEAMQALLCHVADAAPDRARRREMIITEAWLGLPDWKV